MNKDTHIIYLDILRIIAVLQIIIVHISGWGGIESTSIGDFNWLGFDFWGFFGGMGNPLFIMISGAVWCNPLKKVEIKKLYCKNIKRLLMALFFWSFMYNILNRKSIELFLSGGLYEFIYKKSWSIPGHFWFILMIVGIYILLPGIKVIVADDRVLSYLIKIFIFLVILIPSLLSWKLFEVSGSLKEINSTIKNNYDTLGITHWVNYGYFLYGYYLSKISVKKDKVIKFAFLGISSMLIIIFRNYIYSSIIGESFQHYEYSNIFILLGVTTEFIIIRYCFENIDINNKISNIIRIVSENCFGIYILHVFAFSIFMLVGINALSIWTFFGIPLIAIVTAIISLIGSYCLRKNKIFKALL